MIDVKQIGKPKIGNAGTASPSSAAMASSLWAALGDKVDTAFFKRVFGILDASGNEIEVNDTETEIGSVKVKYGMWTEEYLSALGKSAGTGGGGSGHDLLQDWSQYDADAAKGMGLSAYLGYGLRQDVESLKGGSALTFTTTGTGNVVTSVTKSGTRVTVTMGTVDLSPYATKGELEAKADKSVSINAGTGLAGGGDLSASRTLALAAVGTAGTYTKVTTDAYGRVAGGTTLSASDIPTLAISKISGLQAALDSKLNTADFAQYFAEQMAQWFVRDTGNKGLRPADFGGEAYGLYSNSFVSALGLSSSTGNGGGDYNRLDDWGDYDTSKATWALSAKLGYSLYQDVNSLKGGSALSFITVGSGNVVSAISKSGTTVTVTKGITALTSVSLSTISDLHANWDALLKAAPSAFVTRWPTISEVTSKQSLAIKLNGGTTEGTNLFTYNGTAAKTVNITTANIGADVKFVTAIGTNGNYLTWTKNGATNNVTVPYATKAAQLANARTINGTSFNGTADITTAQWGTARNINISDATASNTGAAVSVNGGSNVTLKLPSTIAAALSGNATSATKLQTARTLWGQSFNGTANVSGAMSGVGNISMTDNAILKGIMAANDYWQIHGTGSSDAGAMYIETGDNGNEPIYVRQLNTSAVATHSITLMDGSGNQAFNAVTASGMFTANGGVTVPSSKTIKLGSGTISWDTTNNMFHFSHGVYSDGAVSALGTGSVSGGGGGGGSVDLLQDWSQYDAGTAKSVVLSAYLGYGLKQDLQGTISKIGKTSDYIGTIDLSDIDDISFSTMTNGESMRYIVTTQGVFYNFAVGVMDVFSDSMGHVMTEILYTHYVLNSDSSVNSNAHQDGTMFIYFRSRNVGNAPELPDVPSGEWSRWKKLYGYGAEYMGVAKPTTEPYKFASNFMFYIATEKGTYTNFDSLSVADGEIAIFHYYDNGGVSVDMWNKETLVSLATTSQAGLMSASDKTKLIAALTSVNIATIGDLHSSWDALLKAAPREATTSNMGFMSASDKEKLDGLEPDVLTFSDISNVQSVPQQSVAGDIMIMWNLPTKTFIVSNNGNYGQNWSADSSKGIAAPDQYGTRSMNGIIPAKGRLYVYENKYDAKAYYWDGSDLVEIAPAQDLSGYATKKDLENATVGGALNFNTTGTGNVVTAVTKNGTTVTVNKGLTALTSVSLATITDLHSSWDSLLKASPSSHITRWPTFSEVTSKPTTLSGYGITDAYTKTDADSRYVNVSGDTMTGLLTVTSGSTHKGLKVGSVYVNAISDNLILQGVGTIRFGGDGWAYNDWGGLAYDKSKKYLYFGIADGTIFDQNAGALSGGSILTPGISNIYVGNNTTNKVWHAGNDGSGSGLDADTLDGKHASSFLTSVSIATISDLNGGWDALLKAAPAAATASSMGFMSAADKAKLTWLEDDVLVFYSQVGSIQASSIQDAETTVSNAIVYFSTVTKTFVAQVTSGSTRSYYAKWSGNSIYPDYGHYGSYTPDGINPARGRVYIQNNNNTIYHWSGSSMVELSPQPNLSSYATKTELSSLQSSLSNYATKTQLQELQDDFTDVSNSIYVMEQMGLLKNGGNGYLERIESVTPSTTNIVMTFTAQHLTSYGTPEAGFQQVTLPTATSTQAGLMSASDKKKLVAALTSVNIATIGDLHSSWDALLKAAPQEATTSNMGFMSAADKADIDYIYGANGRVSFILTRWFTNETSATLSAQKLLKIDNKFDLYAIILTEKSGNHVYHITEGTDAGQTVAVCGSHDAGTNYGYIAMFTMILPINAAYAAATKYIISYL